MKLKVLICGGGNGAHVLAGLTASNSNTESSVLTLYGNDADLWNKALQNQPLSRIFTTDKGDDFEINSRPHIISKVPSAVVPGADLILITVPAFSHETYLTAIEPYIKCPTALVGFPAQPGFEFQSRSILKDKLELLTIMSAQTFPWACRILEKGRKVKILGTKKSVKVATIWERAHAQRHGSALEVLQSVIGSVPVLTQANHFLELSLRFDVAHPGLMYGKWKDWDGNPVPEKPLFYQGADDDQVKCVTELDDEILHTAKEISKYRPDIDLSGCISTFEWLVTSYGTAIADPSCLKTALITNKAYDGLTHPMKRCEGKFVPDFMYRYLSEDIPFGLVVTKGLAEIVGANTPVTDRVIAWAQKKLDKEFIVGSQLRGKDLYTTRAPQAYGITSLDDLEYLLGQWQDTKL